MVPPSPSPTPANHLHRRRSTRRNGPLLSSIRVPNQRPNQHYSHRDPELVKTTNRHRPTDRQRIDRNARTRRRAPTSLIPHLLLRRRRSRAPIPQSPSPPPHRRHQRGRNPSHNLNFDLSPGQQRYNHHNRAPLRPDHDLKIRLPLRNHHPHRSPRSAPDQRALCSKPRCLPLVHGSNNSGLHNPGITRR